jgi:hypothetical protein
LRNTSVVNLGNPREPAKMKIIVVGADTTVSLGGDQLQYAHIYAPQSGVTVFETTGFYGRIVGRMLALRSGSNLYYDDVIQHTRDYHITLVK